MPTRQIESVNPANGDVIETYEVFDESRIEASVAKATGPWRKSGWDERAQLLTSVAAYGSTRWPPG